MLALSALEVESSPILPHFHRADPRDPVTLGWSWWLFAAHGRHVAKVAESLRFADVPHVLPVREVERVREKSRARYTVREPIFGSYLFVAGEDEFARHEALSAVPGKLTLGIPVFDVANLVGDLGQLLDAIEAGAPLGDARPAPKSGDRVVVTSGIWQGIEGVLMREAHGGHSLLLHVRSLGQVVPLEVEAWRCEAIGDPDQG